MVRELENRRSLNARKKKKKKSNHLPYWEAALSNDAAVIFVEQRKIIMNFAIAML